MPRCMHLTILISPLWQYASHILCKVPAGRENNGAVVHGNKMYLLLGFSQSTSATQLGFAKRVPAAGSAGKALFVPYTWMYVSCLACGGSEATPASLG